MYNVKKQLIFSCFVLKKTPIVVVRDVCLSNFTEKLEYMYAIDDDA